MSRSNSFWLWSAFVAGLLAVGIPYWQIPYSKLSLPDTLIHPGLVVVIVAAALVRALGMRAFARTALIVGAAVPCVVMARVVFDALHDPTTHNLWPLELIIAAGIGLLASTAGALAGSIPGFTARGSTRHDS